MSNYREMMREIALSQGRQLLLTKNETDKLDKIEPRNKTELTVGIYNRPRVVNN